MMPETAEQWWALVEQYHDELCELVSAFHPCNHSYTDFVITAASAEAACEWFGMPESTEVRSYPGFGVLCNLCSESYVLYEGDEDAID